MPLLFSFTHLNRKIPLKGAVTLNVLPTLNLGSWLNGEFQNKFEKYINDNIGFRPYLVRLRNQVAYTLYDKINARGVIRGKENYLYELNYIKAYNGVDFVGFDSITHTILRIKRLQDTLQAMGKSLLVCLAPGKGSFYPEYFPEKYDSPKTDTTNYKVFSRQLKESGINHIDFNHWFLEMKDTSRYILYPKYGIHWSFYGMLMAEDSLIHYLEASRGIDMPDLILGEYKLSGNLARMDYDIADGMNLIFQLPSEQMCYPEFAWEQAEGKTKPKVIVISDSFYWSMFNTGIWTKSFSPGGFWFYNRQIYPESFSKPTMVEDIDQKEAIDSNDIFILLTTEANLPKFPWGFVRNVLSALDNKTENSERTSEEKKFRAELQKHINNIRGNNNWMKDIRRKAEEKNISVDSMLTLDAMWMIEYKKSKQNKGK
ncbi:MAG: hypothetical protein GXO81_00280 [Chlorobi bacterium]|nr:hypothetical protein [Chlorobiota bacterium]